MADILERKIPYLFPGDLELRLDAQNFVTAISGYPVGDGGGTVVESAFIWKPVINQDGTIGWERDTSATTPATANLVPHIYNNYWYVGTSNTNVEARGPQGSTGADGKSLSADYEEDSVNRQTQVKIGQINGSEQTSFYLPWGVNGTNGTNGTNGISLSAKTSTITGGHRVEIWEKGAAQYDDSFDVMDGEDGDSPTVTVTNIPADPDDPVHKNGGTEITITDATSTNKFSAWNGNDGTIAGAPGIEGNNGISAALDGSTYKVGLSAAFYTAVTSVSSKLNESDFTTYTATTAPGAFQPKGNYASASDISDMATKTWVGQQNYLTTVATSGSIIGTGLSTNKIGLVTSAENALTAVANKADQNGNYQNLSAGSATSAYSAYSAYSASYATTAASAYIDSNTTSAMSNIVNELHGKTSVTINTANNEIKDGTSAVSAMSYIANSQHAGWEPQKSCVCQESEIYAMSQLANGQGMLFFVVSAR